MKDTKAFKENSTFILSGRLIITNNAGRFERCDSSKLMIDSSDLYQIAQIENSKLKT